jgi:hypothetical protein
MKKRIRRTADKKKEDELERDSSLIRAAITELDLVTRGKICAATGLKLGRLVIIFAKNKDLYSLYKIRRKNLAHLAADNIADILMDKDHPSFFAASKLILSKYRSDLDETLETHEDSEDEVSVAFGKASTASPVTVSFKKAKKKEEED